MRVLLIADRDLAAPVQDGLRQDGCVVSVLEDIEQADTRVTSGVDEMVVLDQQALGKL